MSDRAPDRGDGAPRLVGVSLGDHPDAWAGLGFTVEDGGIDLGALRVRCRGDGGPPALEFDRTHPGGGDAFLGVPWRAVPERSSSTVGHANGIDAIDHVVITAADAPSVRAALGAAGLDVRRERAARLGDAEIVQLFAFAGDVLLELVAPGDGDASGSAGGAPTGLWGLAVTAPDLDATVDRLGAACGPPSDAVQHGRRIATVRSAGAGISVRLAIMSPRAEERAPRGGTLHQESP